LDGYIIQLNQLVAAVASLEAVSRPTGSTADLKR
jgi:hypothetical protein